MSEPKQATEHPLVLRIRDGLRVSKIVCSRSVKTPDGETTVEFTTSLTAEGLESDLTLQESRVAALLLGLRVDRTAYQNAHAGGILSKERYLEALREVNTNYGRLLLEMLQADAETR